MPRLLPEVDPADQLNILDSVMALPGAGAVHYRILRQCLQDGLPLAAYSNPELAGLTHRSERTIRSAKSWFHKHLQQLRQFSAAWLVEVTFSMDSLYREGSLPPSHAAESCRPEEPAEQTEKPADFCLSVEKLKEIGWGKLLGCFQVRDPELFTRRFSAKNVLYAVWCAEGHHARNPAGFVTFKLQQGLEAPEGWSYPIKDESSASVAAFMRASAAQPAPAQPQTGNQLVLQFTENPGDIATTRLRHYGFRYDSATRQWSAPETPATREVWEDELELGTTGFKRPTPDSAGLPHPALLHRS